MTGALARLRQQLGYPGLIALVVLAAAGAFHIYIVSPLHQHSVRLDLELERIARAAAPDGISRASAKAPAAQMATFYAFFDREQRIDDWLAKLYATAMAAGLDLRTGDYRLAERRYRMERYRIRFPVTGSYSQIRAFLEAALIEIPVLSVDQASFRRKDANEGRVDAELVLTLHLLSR